MDINALHTNQKLLLKELENRGATWEMIDPFDELIAVYYKGKTEYILDRFSSKVPFNMVKVSADKHLAKKILKKNGLSVPHGEVFSSQNKIEIPYFAKTIYPLVIKPNWGSHGDFVHVDIENEEQLIQAINNFQSLAGRDTPFILEEFKPWSEHRFFITSLGEFAVVHREPASVVGDGLNMLSYLVSVENEIRRKLKKNKPTSLCPIVIDDEVRRYLSKQDKALNYLPNRGEKVILRQESNLAKGGMALNMTNMVHPSFVEIAKKALAAFPGLPCVGLDVLAKDIKQEANPDNYVIIEANSSPGLAMHTYPSFGSPQDVASMLANVMFPDFFKD